jgi:hypothetical protein
LGFSCVLGLWSLCFCLFFLSHSWVLFFSSSLVGFHLLVIKST